MTHPAPPGEATPLTDAIDYSKYGALDKVRKLTRSLERQLAQAQARVAELEKERDVLKHHIAVTEAISAGKPTE